MVGNENCRFNILKFKIVYDLFNIFNDVFFFIGFRFNNFEKYKMNLNGVNNEFFGYDK